MPFKRWQKRSPAGAPRQREHRSGQPVHGGSVHCAEGLYREASSAIEGGFVPGQKMGRWAPKTDDAPRGALQYLARSTGPVRAERSETTLRVSRRCPFSCLAAARSFSTTWSRRDSTSLTLFPSSAA